MEMGQINNRRSTDRAKPVSLKEGLRHLLLGLKYLVLVSLVVAMMWLAEAGFLYLNRPVQLVSVQGDFKNVSREELATWIEPFIDGGMVSLNLETLRQAMKKHPWIAEAQVSRRWPESLLIAVTEEVPVARWGKAGFLNSQGNALAIEDNSHLRGLPKLQGPEGWEQALMSRYVEWGEVLGTAGIKIAGLEMNGRGSWEIELENSSKLILGRHDFDDKLQRFLSVWSKQLQEKSDRVLSVDLRYGNGIAVRWHEPELAWASPAGGGLTSNQQAGASGKPESA